MGVTGGKMVDSGCDVVYVAKGRKWRVWMTDDVKKENNVSMEKEETSRKGKETKER